MTLHTGIKTLKFSELLAEYLRMREIDFDPLRHRSKETVLVDEKRMAAIEEELDRRMESVRELT